jgi:hypothetical protein
MLNDSDFPFENTCMRKRLWPKCNIMSRHLSGEPEEKYEIFEVRQLSPGPKHIFGSVRVYCA